MRKIIFTFFLLVVCIAVLFTSCNDSIGMNKKLIENWISVDSTEGCDKGGVFDKRWSESTFKGLSVRAKLKEPLDEQEKDKYLDLAYEIKAKLLAPNFSHKTRLSEEGKYIVGYEIDLEFTLYDEDGFIIHRLKTAQWVGNTIYHPARDNFVMIRFTKEIPYEGDVKAMMILKNAVPERIAKKTAEITYRPILEPVIHDAFEKVRIRNKAIKE